MWRPWMLDRGIRPWELRRFTIGELESLMRDEQARERAREAGE